jgi:hypothetical protein
MMRRLSRDREGEAKRAGVITVNYVEERTDGIG